MVRKFVSFFVALLFVFCLSFSVSASGDTLEISFSEPKVLEQGVFELEVNIDKNPGIVSLRLEIQYDKSCLTLLEIEDCKKLGEDYHSDNLSADKLYLYWSNPLSEKDITYCGTVAVLKFANTSEKTDISSVTLLCNADNYDALNYDLKKVKTSLPKVELSLSGNEDNASSEPTSLDNIGNYGIDIEEPEIQKDTFVEDVPIAVYISIGIGFLICGIALIVRRSKK